MEADDKTRIALLEQAVAELRRSNERWEVVAREISEHMRNQAVQASDIRGITNRIGKYETQCDLCRVRIDKLDREFSAASASKKTAVAMITLLVSMAAAVGSLVSVLLGKA